MDAYRSKYHEIEPIGQGSFGTVYLVKELSTGLFFAAKQMSLINMSPDEVKVAHLEVLLLTS